MELESLTDGLADLGLDPADPHLALGLQVALLASSVIRADRVVLAEERNALRQLLDDHIGLGPEIARTIADHALGLAELPTGDELVEALRDLPRGERIVLVDAFLGICTADGSLDGREEADIAAIVRRLGVPTATYRDLLRKWDPRGSRGTRHTALGDTPVTVGSGPASVIRLTGLTVSRHHAVISRAGDGWVIEDLGSTNGTWVNGQRVRRQPVTSHDIIRVEHHCLRLDERAGQVRVWDANEFLTLCARELSVEVPGEGQARRRILDRVSVTLRSGELLAVVGPSGSGKTTFVSALLGAAAAGDGQVTLNGEACNLLRDHASRVGVVPQDDIVHGELTVEESLRYSARLRSVRGATAAAIDDAVERVIDQLGLAPIRTHRIGDPVRRGISGGERKRVNLGQELLNADTPILALDEPTTGLDPHTGMEIMRLLRQLADQGRIVVAVTHLVDEELLDLVDKVLVLGVGGEMLYFGPATELMTAFELDGISDLFQQAGSTERVKALAPEFRRSSRYRRFVELPRLLNRGPGDERARSTGELVLDSLDLDTTFASPSSTLESPWQTVEMGRTLVATMSSMRMFVGGTASGRSGLVDRVLNRLRQALTLTSRYARVKVRNRAAMAVAIGQAPLIVLGCWLVLMHTLSYEDSRLDAAFTTIPGSLPFILVISAFWLGCVNAVRELVAEQAIFHRERNAGVGVATYLGSKLAVLFALTAAQCVLLLLVAQLLFGLSARHMDPLRAAVILTGVGLFGVSLGLAVSALFRTAEAAVGALPALVIPQLLFGGLLVPLDRMPAVLRACSYLAASRWGMAGLLQSGDPGIGSGGVAMVTECTQFSPPAGDTGACVHGFLETLGFARSEAIEGSLIATRIVVDAGWLECCAALAGLTLGCSALAAMALHRRG